LNRNSEEQPCSDSQCEYAEPESEAAHCIPFADRYEILSCIGSGGMGAVYLARQTVIERLVALKLLLPQRGLDELSLRRLRQEARAASQLAHPNIVRVFDFGVWEDIPYLAMEYVDGRSLQQIIRENGPLDVEKAAHIFVQACDGLEVAHEQGVIHRDLKPGNIIIANNGTGQDHVKIVDFGIAKLARSESADDIHLTRTGEVVGSPPYMSPEQCLGRSLDQRSDIYSMGCVMYEVLTGHPPFRGATFVEIGAKHLGETPPALISACPRKKEVELLQPIVMKALAKDPEHRFAAMSEMKAALTEAAALMKAGRLVRAKRWWKSRRLKRWQPLDKRRSLALLLIAVCAVIAGRLAAFCLVNMQSPTVPESPTPVVSDPAASWNRFDIDGQDAFNRGDYDEARQNFQSAARIADTFSKTDRLALSLEKLAVLFHVLKQSEEEREIDVKLSALKHEDPTPMNHGEESHQGGLFEGMLNMLPTEPARIDRGKFDGLAQQMNQLARHYINDGHAEQAIRLEMKLIPRIRQVLGARHVRLCRALRHLGDALVECKQYNRAVVALRESVAIAAKLSPGDRDLPAGLRSLAGALEDRGDYSEAIDLYKRALAVELKYASERTEDIAWSYWGLGGALKKQNKNAAAENAFGLALRSFEKTHDHEMIGACVEQLAWLCQHFGEDDRAEQFYLQTLNDAERRLGQEDPAVAIFLQDLGRFYWRRDKIDRAEPLLRRALAIRQHTLLPHESKVCESLQDLSAIYDRAGQGQLATLLTRQELAINERMKRPDLNKLLVSIDILGLECHFQGEVQEARELAQRALATVLSIPVNQYQELHGGFYQLGGLYFVREDYQKVEAWLKHCIAFAKKHKGPGHADAAQSLDDLAHLYYVEGRYSEMIQPSKEAFAIVERNAQINPMQAAQIVENYGAFAQRSAGAGNAQGWRQRAAELRQRAL